MNVETTVQVWEEDGQFVAHAMPLDVMSCGSTLEAARAAVDEAVRAFLATAKETGTLDAILEECGYRQQDRGWIGPAFVAFERHAVVF
ncbi:MAG: hypothetical protein HC897_14795 [Thermoanaerobaculia bacterium]|nr:hypothetical protein [Thermoanaerobaculia bacterium]